MEPRRKGTFDHRDIRISMDMWAADYQYVGTVRRVTGSGTATRAHTKPPKRREGGFSGETIGPAPTQSLGTSGPVSQAAHEAYATNGDCAKSPGVDKITVGHRAGLIKRRIIALDHVQSVLLERITLRLTKAHLDEHPRR